MGNGYSRGQMGLVLVLERREEKLRSSFDGLDHGSMVQWLNG